MFAKQAGVSSVLDVVIPCRHRSHRALNCTEVKQSLVPPTPAAHYSKISVTHQQNGGTPFANQRLKTIDTLRSAHIYWHLRRIRSEFTTARTPVLLVSVLKLTIVLFAHTTPDTTLYFTAVIIGRSSTLSAYNHQKAKSKYRNRIRLERAPQKQSSDAHETPYDRVKRCRERKINTKASECVNVDRVKWPALLRSIMNWNERRKKTVCYSALSGLERRPIACLSAGINPALSPNVRGASEGREAIKKTDQNVFSATIPLP
ncbi:hypothetical protein PR048_018467 [Dryococelus australis]|uniref:Uncharacterized protein n=1 Tax=Dryococelus australis TaxID=614101 RepID=A0ABQ9HCK0_9NEOP|nr:hypothetical protein PR048_018467 [Dryococelus australis]